MRPNRCFWSAPFRRHPVQPGDACCKLCFAHEPVLCTRSGHAVHLVHLGWSACPAAFVPATQACSSSCSQACGKTTRHSRLSGGRRGVCTATATALGAGGDGVAQLFRCGSWAQAFVQAAAAGAVPQIGRPQGHQKVSCWAADASNKLLVPVNRLVTDCSSYVSTVCRRLKRRHAQQKQALQQEAQLQAMAVQVRSHPALRQDLCGSTTRRMLAGCMSW